MKKPLLLLGALIVVGVLIFFARPKDNLVPVEEAKKAQKAGRMTDEERVKYLNEHVKVEELHIKPDTEPESDKLVPGLMRITGRAVNNCNKAIEKANLLILRKNEEGKVITSNLENVAAKGPLKPGESRDFLFRVPAKKDYSGEFDHAWR